jgi:two-component system response regulator NreC
MIETILTDDHRLFADGLEKLLSASGHFKVIAKFHNPKNLLEKIHMLNPQLLILDIDMPDMSGIDVIRRVRMSNETVKIVMLSMHEESVYLQEASALGADGFLNKSAESSFLIESLQRICRGEKLFPKFTKPEFVSDSPLSDRETQVLKLLAKGKTNEEIANEIHLSHLTIKTHRRNMMRKMNVNNAAELISKAVERGYI